MRADVVIVGGGAAGSVLAARLSEDPDRSVLLLEAGPDYTTPDQIPEDLADGRRNAMTSHDWGLSHRPWPGAPVKLPMPRGRVMGGSSQVNTCLAVRSPPDDYDHWGLPGWSWDEVLPYFKKLETDLDFPDAPYHGADGPLPLRRARPDELAPWQAAFVEAALGRGFPACADSNAPGAEGVGPHAVNRTADHRRISAAEAWLTAEVRARPNLRLVAEAHVVRVRLRGGRAEGVVVRQRGMLREVEADTVVLAAGAIHTPGILMRSGIGPSATLRRLGVEVAVDAPGVGARLLDHPGTALFFRPFGGIDRTDRPVIEAALWRRSRRGLLGDNQIQPGSVLGVGPKGVPVVSIMTHVGRTRGVGRLTWHSADPDALPDVRSRLLLDPSDLDVAVDALEIAADLAAHPAMARLAAPAVPNARALASRKLLAQWARTATDSGYHPSGTVPMGLARDPMAPCDPAGRVRGVEGLRVIDASLFPEIPTGNIHLPTLMLAERLADDLRGHNPVPA